MSDSGSAEGATYEFGADPGKVGEYIQELKDNYVTPAVNAIKDVSSLKNVCVNDWAGKASTQFQTNLQTDADKVAEAIEGLFSEIQSQIANASNDWNDFDKNLFS